RVHENERQPDFVKRALVPARSLALAVVEVKQTQLAHPVELPAKLAVDLVEDVAAAGLEIFNLFERLQRWATLRIDTKVPRAQHVQFHVLTAALQTALHSRHSDLLDSLGE